MNEQTLDRRVRKTRAQLRKCLSTLLETKKVQNITVKELAQMADINDNLVPFIEALFLFIYKNKDMSKIFLHEDLEASFSSELRSKLRVCVFNKYKAFIKQKNMPYFELYYDFIISGTVGLLVRWVDSEFEMSPHELAVLTNSFIQSGLTNIIA